MTTAVEPTALDDLDERPHAWLVRAVPGSLVSMIVHAAAIVILALFSIPPRTTPLATILEGVAETADGAELVQPTAFVSTELNLIDSVSPSLVAADLASRSVNDMGQLGAISASLAVGGFDTPATGEVGALFLGDGGRRMGSSVGSDGGGSAQFFGVKATGRRFVFIVDSSNSMRGGKFDAAKEELMYAIRRLSKDQAFYVIFFDQNAERMILRPDKEPPLLPVAATSININRVDQWMKGVENELHTWPYDAVKFAVEMVPDAIYFLTDGKFTDKGRTERYLKSSNYIEDPVDGKKPKVVIHTICFWQNDGEDTLKAIAKDYGGTYRFVPREMKKDK